MKGSLGKFSFFLKRDKQGGRCPFLSMVDVEWGGVVFGDGADNVAQRKKS